MPLEFSIELFRRPFVWKAWISGGACPDTDFMVKECVRFPSKVISDNAPTKLMKASV